MALYYFNNYNNTNNSRIIYSGYLFYFYIPADIKILKYYISRKIY